MGIVGASPVSELMWERACARLDKAHLINAYACRMIDHLKKYLAKKVVSLIAQ